MLNTLLGLCDRRGHSRGGAYETTRLINFTDGLVAVVITIMVLDLKIADGDGWDALLGEFGTSFLSYLLGFLLVAMLWGQHHHLFLVARYTDWRLLWTNFLFMFFLSLLPLCTAWMADYPNDNKPEALFSLVFMYERDHFCRR